MYPFPLNNLDLQIQMDDLKSTYIYNKLESIPKLHLDPTYSKLGRDLNPQNYGIEYKEITNQLKI